MHIVPAVVNSCAIAADAVVHARPVHPPAVGGTHPAGGQDGGVPVAADAGHRGAVPHLRAAEARARRPEGLVAGPGGARPPHAPPEWLLELAEQLRLIEPGTPLPTGMIVGSAVIEKVSRVDSVYRWHLAGARRARRLRKPEGHPQPVWFEPF